MKKTVSLLILLSFIGCIGCNSKENTYDMPEKTEQTISDNGSSITNDAANDIIEKLPDDATLHPTNTPHDEILIAPLSAGLIQVDSHLFKVDGTYTMADLMNTINRNENEYVFYHYFKEPLALDDYAGSTQTLGVRTSTSKDTSLFSVQIANDYEKQSSPTYGESIIERFILNDNYYSLANGFTKGFEISEDDLQKYFQNEGLTEDTERWTQTKNTYIRSLKDGIPSYQAFVVSASNPDMVIVYFFNYKSKDTLSDCGLYLEYANSYSD